jgi:hypothetical protein
METGNHELLGKMYRRYHINTMNAPNIAPYPIPFRVQINRMNLARLLLTEIFHYRGNWKVISNNPCVYGVFSGPLGGFFPREEKCVGCLRCSTEYPDISRIIHNSERSHLGDSYFTPGQYDTIIYEAKTGLVPVKGAGYRGKFGGTGWDGMWTDMSEIVRPTRDGIHGREFISTEIDIGGTPPFLKFSLTGEVENVPENITLPIPLLFDFPPKKAATGTLFSIYSKAAEELQTMTMIPLKEILQFKLDGPHLVPLIVSESIEELEKLSYAPRMIEITKVKKDWVEKIRNLYPGCLIALRLEFGEDPLPYFKEGIRIFHFIANYHGQTKRETFVLDAIRKVHVQFVQAKCRDEVTLLGSGGITAAEHLPKAIICGLDAVVLDTPLLAALQAKLIGECVHWNNSEFMLPSSLSEDWGVQRLKNLVNSWRDQLLEILGAMGMREVRRMRGEIGRALFQADSERDAFSGIEGYEKR